jgi:hypothetical protein
VSQIDQVIDHQAALQAEINMVKLELAALCVATIALTILVMILRHQNAG